MNPPEQQVMMVLSNLPDRAAAEQLATHLVEQRLAACVNILPRVRSIYRWKGKVESASEVLCLIKTTAGALARLERHVRASHPYECFEFVVLRPSSVERRYLAWLKAETSA